MIVLRSERTLDFRFAIKQSSMRIRASIKTPTDIESTISTASSGICSVRRGCGSIEHPKEDRGCQSEQNLLEYAAV